MPLTARSQLWWLSSVAIAVIGWGSLIWSPKELDIEPVWRPDGPRLPVEFARISSENRLTLVLVEGAPAQQTLWAVSRKATLEEAVEDLRTREGTGPRGVGWWSAEPGHGGEWPYADVIGTWAESRGLSGVVWTALGPTDLEKRPGRMSDAERLQYLRGLVEAGREAAAREYFERAPEQIQTPFRALVRKELGWGRLGRR